MTRSLGRQVTVTLVALFVVTSGLVAFVGGATAVEPDVFPTNTQNVRSIAYGQTITGEIDVDDPEYDNDPAEPVTFAGTAGDFVVVDANAMYDVDSEANDMEIALVSPSGDEIAYDDDSGVGSSGYDSRIGIELPESGTYTIHVSGRGDLMAYSLSLRSVSIENLRAISYGQTRYGEIDVGDPRNSNYEGYHEPVTFTGSAGEYVLIDEQTLTSDGDTYLWLLDPSGSQIAEDDDSGIGGDDYNSRIGIELPSSGTYTIIAGSYGTDELLNYSLQVRRPNLQNNLRAISYGETRYGVVTNSDPEVTAGEDYDIHEPVTFQGSANDFVNIELQTLTSEGDVEVWLLDPNGNELDNDDDGGNGGDDYNSRIGYTLPEDGEYTIIASGRGDPVEYALTLEVQATQQDLRSISTGDTLYGNVDANDPQDGAYNGYHEPVTFTGSTDDDVLIDMRTLTEDGDTYLWLLDPSGNELASDDDDGLGGDEYNSRLRYTLPEDGEYTIIAGSSGTDELLTYGLRLLGPSQIASTSRGDPARFDVIRTQINETRIEAGDTVEIVIDVANTGGREARYAAILSADLQRLDTQRAVIEPGSVAQFRFVQTFDEPDTHEIFVRSKFVGTIVVRPPDETIDTVFQTGANREEIRIDVTTAREGVGLFLGLPATGPAREVGATFDSVNVTTTRDVSYELDILQSKDAPPAFPGFENGSRAILFANVSTTLSDADVESAVFEFNVRNGVLQGVDPANVVLFRYDGSELTTLETTVVEETDTLVRFRATSPGFSVFAIGIKAPEFSVLAPRLSETNITVGDDLDISAIVRNSGGAAGTFTTELALDGGVIGTREINVPAGESRTVRFTRTIDESGTFAVSVGGVSAGTLTVNEMATPTPEDEMTEEQTPAETPTASPEQDTPTESGGDAGDDTETTAAGGPGFTAVLAVLALLALTGIAARRRE